MKFKWLSNTYFIIWNARHFGGCHFSGITAFHEVEQFALSQLNTHSYATQCISICNYRSMMFEPVCQ